MPDWIEKYWIEWIFGILCAVLAFLYRSLASKLKKQKTESDAVKDGIRALLQRQIDADCKECIREGYCPTERKNVILCMYDSYHALGGNGAISQLKNRMMELPNERNERRES